MELVARLLDDHLYAAIADILNERGLRSEGSAWPGRHAARFTALRVQYLVHTYGIRSRFDRLRVRGLLTKDELAQRLGIHAHTLTLWAQHGIGRSHAYNGHAWLYEDPGPNPPIKQCSRWNPLVDRVAAAKIEESSKCSDQI